MATFFELYGMQILTAITTAIFGFVGITARILVQRYIDDDTKRALAKTVCMFVEQTYKDVHGEEKLRAAIHKLCDMLTDRGIHVTVGEAETLIEAAVGEYNAQLNK